MFTKTLSTLFAFIFALFFSCVPQGGGGGGNGDDIPFMPGEDNPDECSTSDLSAIVGNELRFEIDSRYGIRFFTLPNYTFEYQNGSNSNDGYTYSFISNIGEHYYTFDQNMNFISRDIHYYDFDENDGLYFEYENGRPISVEFYIAPPLQLFIFDLTTDDRGNIIEVTDGDNMRYVYEYDLNTPNPFYKTACLAQEEIAYIPVVMTPNVVMRCTRFDMNNNTSEVIYEAAYINDEHGRPTSGVLNEPNNVNTNIVFEYNPCE